MGVGVIVTEVRAWFMAKFVGKFESAKQDWETPIELFKKFNDIYEYSFDLAASKENSKCKSFFSKEDNSLHRGWSGLGNCWLNPPYGDKAANRLSAWIDKAYKETEKDSSLLVSLLIPARTNTNWFLDYCLLNSFALDFIIGRPKFGGATHGLPQPLVVVTFHNPKLHAQDDLETINAPKIRSKVGFVKI